MSEPQPLPRVFLGMPGYGQMTPGAARGLWCACADPRRAIVKYQYGSLLAANFNELWATALNIQRSGCDVKYFAMLHDDVGPEDYWLDTLIDEMEAHDLDMLGTVVPIKDRLGLTSLALDDDRPGGTTWSPLCRLTMREVFGLSETFTSDDVGHPLLLNTGCWVCRFDPEWNTRVHFTVNDRIVFSTQTDRYEVETESEDWYFSRLCHELGLKIGATRKVQITHRGYADFGNHIPWGDWSHDQTLVSSSVLQTNTTPADELAPVLLEI